MREHTLTLTCRELMENPLATQRELAACTGVSLGKMNQTIQEGKQKGYIVPEQTGYVLSDEGHRFMDQFKVDSAVLLAAGFGARCVPLTFETPKGLLKVKGVPMVERQIEQLLERGIRNIILVVGYMKERFDYLIDKYGVTLIYNPEYATKNNLTSLYYALPYLKNSYLLCADNYIEENVFHAYEAESWFSCLYQEGKTAEWCVTSEKNGRIENISVGGADAWAVVGPAYFTREFSNKFAQLVREYYNTPGTEDWYWEHILLHHLHELPLYMKKFSSDNVHEFENLAELRQYDKTYINESNSKIMEQIARLYNVQEGEIHNIYPLKDGVTNQSFHFAIGEDRYVFRIPGTGTEELINRANEKKVYEAIGSLGLSDEVVSFDAESGIKISKYYPDTRIVDPSNEDELRISMRLAKQVHEKCLKVEHSFGIEKMIDYYQSLAEAENGIHFTDIEQTKQKVKRLLALREELAIPEILCHGDYAHTNVLILPNGDAKMIDWEYSGMADPIMDVAMYAIYAQFDREQIDKLLRLYCDCDGREPTKQEWTRHYMYVALGGFLWCMWSEYKQALGQEFGDYPLKMYRYAKDYYKILTTEGYMEP